MMPVETWATGLLLLIAAFFACPHDEAERWGNDRD